MSESRPVDEFADVVGDAVIKAIEAAMAPHCENPVGPAVERIVAAAAVSLSTNNAWSCACGATEFRVHAGAFAPPNHTFKVWRVTCANGHSVAPKGEFRTTIRPSDFGGPT